MAVWDIKSLSKDILDGILIQAGKQKDILVEAIASEFSKFLNRLNVTEELKKLVQDLAIHIDADIKISRKSTGEPITRIQRVVKLKARPEKKSPNQSKSKAAPKKHSTKKKSQVKKSSSVKRNRRK